MNKKGIIPETNYQEKGLDNFSSDYLNSDISISVSQALRPYGDKIIGIIRHGEPEKLDTGEKGGLTEKGKKQIEEQAERLKNFYGNEKITLFCDLQTQRIRETFEILSDEKYGLNLEIIEDRRLSTSDKSQTTGNQINTKAGDISEFWNEQILAKHRQNIIILGHSSFISSLKNMPEDKTPFIENRADEIGDGEVLHIRLDSENNKKDILNGKLNINFFNFEEIKQDLLSLNNQELNKILNLQLDKNTIGNLLNSFFDENIDFIINNLDNLTNIDLKDFFIYKLYILLKEGFVILDNTKIKSEKYVDINNVIKKILYELKIRDFSDLGNLVKIIDTMDRGDKMYILGYMQREVDELYNKNEDSKKNILNFLLLYDKVNDNLYEIWRIKKGKTEQIEMAEKIIEVYNREKKKKYS